MSEQASDGIAETLDSMNKAVFMETVRAAEAALNRRRELARAAEREDRGAAGGAGAEMRVEVAISEAKLRPTVTEKWQAAATQEAILERYAEARAWDGMDRRFAPYARHLEELASKRFDMDLEAAWRTGRVEAGLPAVAPAHVPETPAEKPQEAAQKPEKTPASTGKTQDAQAATVAQEPAQEPEAAPVPVVEGKKITAWDSPERRAARQKALEEKVAAGTITQEDMDAAMVVDWSLAHTPGRLPTPASAKDASAQVREATRSAGVDAAREAATGR